MRVVALYKQQRDYTRQVEDYLADFTRQTGRELEVMDPESKEGMSFCEAQDILEFPAIVAITDEGQAVSTWKGFPLPLVNEVSYYVQ
jgi:fructoselysine-6-P-deglycase FrlB-like protein